MQTVRPLGPFAPGRLAAFGQSVAGVRNGSNSRDARVADGIFILPGRLLTARDSVR